jgi:hypothetical protein
MADDCLQAAGGLTMRNVDLSRKYKDQARADLTGRQELFPGGESSRFAEVPYPLDLDRIERGKHLIVTPFNQRLG